MRKSKDGERRELKSPALRRGIERVAIVGLGYIGLPTAAAFASAGLEVVGIDLNQRAVDAVNRGEIHIFENDLAELVQQVHETGRLSATNHPTPADAFIIAVGTPCSEGHRPDITAIESAARDLSRVLVAGNLVILESTSPPGTTEHLCAVLAAYRPDLTFPHLAGDDADIQVAHCPERVLPGRIVRELVENDRIIGGVSPRCAQRAADLYRVFVQGECITTSARMAELVKLSENAFRDVNIAFANEMSLICDKLELDVWELIALANRHPRVNILQPGPGVGGHCIAVDPWFIVHSAPEQSRLIRAAREVNDSKPKHVVAKVKQKAARLKQPVIACLGLAFKPDIDDLRESPAIEIVRDLVHEEVGEILAVEPNIRELPRSLAEIGVRLVDETTAIEVADIVLLLVHHREFVALDPSLLAEKTVIDTRGIWQVPPAKLDGRMAA